MNDIISVVLTAIADIIIAIVVTKLYIKISEKQQQQDANDWDDHVISDLIDSVHKQADEIDKLKKRNKELLSMCNEKRKQG